MTPITGGDRPGPNRPGPPKPPLDLNLLVVLNALLVHRHVSRAAETLGVGQPAASAALKRLRRHYDDVLLERVGNTLVLTPFATELAPRVAQTVADLQRVIDAELGFDASSAQREFTLVLSDAAAAVILPPLLRRLAAEAPDVRVTTHQHGNPDDDLETTLRSHDGVVLPHDLTGETHAVPLFEDHWVCVADPCQLRGVDPLALDEAAHRTWVLVQTSALDQPIGLAQLLSLGVQPRVRLVLDHFSSIPSALLGTENLAIVPHRLAAAHPAFANLRTTPCPWPTPPFRLALHWHPTLEQDAGHRWFRGVMEEVAATL